MGNETGQKVYDKVLNIVRTLKGKPV